MKQVEGIWLPDGDTHFEAHLRKGKLFNGAGTYQYVKIEMALAECEDRRGLAVDVGAHVGLWTRVLAYHFKSVVAFEPVPLLVNCWKANCGKILNAELRHVALSDGGSDHIGMEPALENSGNCRVYRAESTSTLSVAASSLDRQAGLDGLDFLKIDVEGWEEFVVRGGEQLIRSRKPVVVVEQKPGNAEAYGLRRRGAEELLQSWGARKLWERSGDVCMGFKK